MKTLSLIIITALLTTAFISHAEPPELKQHRDAKSKQDLKTYLDRQDNNLEWRLKHFDNNHDGTLDAKELAAALSLNPKGITSQSPGLPGHARLPWVTAAQSTNPNGVVAPSVVAHHNPFRIDSHLQPTPKVALVPRATLGCPPESRRDSPNLLPVGQASSLSH